MEAFFRITLFVAGVINLIPSVLAFLPQRITNSYGVLLTDANLELLLRHRAVLFGIVGGLLIYSAFSKKYYDLSVLVGLVSMVSFIVLYFSLNGTINAELTKVMKIDVVAIIILLIGYGVYRFYI